ncbi:MAG: DUF2721 domain-containing protein [Epulopiscium sp.]|nr:DUF2721 domain-containing protein [Candidatus Epulonipiscium sp.]
MELSLTTPALLFPAISLLLLAYTNRFLVLAQLVRELHEKFNENPDEILSGQIDNLQKRINLIRNMQILGVSSFFLCVLCMFLIFAKYYVLADLTFGISLIFLMTSLGFSIRELLISVKALTLQLSNVESKKNK